MPAKHIPVDVTAGETEMAKVIDRDPAAINARLYWLERNERVGAWVRVLVSRRAMKEASDKEFFWFWGCEKSITNPPG